MREVGVYEAKTHLARLIDEVEHGEEVTITRHGKPVARLVPVAGSRRSVDETIAALRAFGARHPRNGLNLRELIEEGRRF